jgi:hypothetical protein
MNLKGWNCGRSRCRRLARWVFGINRCQLLSPELSLEAMPPVSPPLRSHWAFGIVAPQIRRAFTISLPAEAPPFIDHSSEMWNFCRDRS